MEPINWDCGTTIGRKRDNGPPPWCQSDYGPVRNARLFDIPDPAEIEAIIERRFGPLRAIFANGGEHD